MSGGHTAAENGPALRVGFIGLGSQGGPMACRIAEAGFPTRLWARRPETLDPFAELPVEVAGSPAELGAASDVVCVCVLDDAGVEEVVVAGPDGVLSGMRPGGVVVVHSTVHPDTCRRLDERAARHHVALLDVPVSGGGQAAAAGSPCWSWRQATRTCSAVAARFSATDRATSDASRAPRGSKSSWRSRPLPPRPEPAAAFITEDRYASQGE